jgi:hypothetical protein
MRGPLDDAFNDLAMLRRLSRDLPRFYRDRLDAAGSDEWHRERLADRAGGFLRVVERQIYAVPNSPYRLLLTAAGCELGDVHRLVAEEGLHGALDHLCERGVYVTYDEFRGRREVVRGSQRFHFRDGDFDNPLAAPHYEALTGGTRGRRGRVPYSLPYIVESGMSFVSAFNAHGLLGTPHAFWETGPINHLIRLPKYGTPIAAWFYPLTPLPWSVRLGAAYLAVLARLAGHRLPLPTHADLQDPIRVVEWLAHRTERGERTCLLTPVSSAVRVATMAREHGRSLGGVTFFVRSEPCTRARREAIEASGARVVVGYGSTEISVIGISCANPRAADDVHAFESRYAVTQRVREPIPGAPDVLALMFTSLTDHAPKTLLNVETGDYADVERRSGDCCALGALGLTLHLSNIRSFEKLSSEGTTFAASNLTTVLEEVLPSRFGGTGVDYQLVETERPGGLSSLVLRVNPALGDLDPDALRDVFLGALSAGGAQERHQAHLLERTRAVVVRRERPFVTAAGKTMPFQLLRAPAVADDDPATRTRQPTGNPSG